MVIAIIAVLSVFTLVAVGSVGSAANLSRAGQTFGDMVALARQEASTRNRDVHVRLIELDPVGSLRAAQLWIAEESGTCRPHGQILKFPDGIILSSNSTLSPLISAESLLAGTDTFGGYGSRPYHAFRIRAGGKLLSSISTNNFLTLQVEGAPGVPPVNFYSLRVNPVTGRVTTHRP